MTLRHALSIQAYQCVGGKITQMFYHASSVINWKSINKFSILLVTSTSFLFSLFHFQITNMSYYGNGGYSPYGLPAFGVPPPVYGAPGYMPPTVHIHSDNHHHGHHHHGYLHELGHALTGHHHHYHHGQHFGHHHHHHGHH